MLYSSSVILKLYRPVPLWQYAAVFLVVGLVHGLLLAVLGMQDAPQEKPLLTQRLLARTILLPAPTASVAPVARPSVPVPPVSTPQVPAPVVRVPPRQSPTVPPRSPARETLHSEPHSEPHSRPMSKPVSRPVSKPAPDPASKKIVPVPAAPVPSPTLTPALNPSAMPAAPVVEQVAARYDAAYLHNPAPAYPVMSRRRREQGTVQLQVWVSADGRAGKVTLLKSSGFERLDAAAADTVRQWRFVPARRGDVAMASSVVVPIVFALN